MTKPEGPPRAAVLRFSIARTAHSRIAPVARLVGRLAPALAMPRTAIGCGLVCSGVSELGRCQRPLQPILISTLKKRCYVLIYCHHMYICYSPRAKRTKGRPHPGGVMDQPGHRWGAFRWSGAIFWGPKVAQLTLNRESKVNRSIA